MEQDNKRNKIMKKIIYITGIIIIQYLALNIQNSFAQAPFNTPDNVNSGNCIEFVGNSTRVDIPDIPCI